MASRATRSHETDDAKDFAAVALAYAREAVADKGGKRFCKWVRLAAKRHLDDLKRKNWGYRFDPWHANDVCDFIEKLPHVEGQWLHPTIDLEPAQVFILAVCFGWRRTSDGRRRFTSAYIEVARKNAKSTLTAGVALYCACCEGEVGPLVLIAASTGDQARKVFNPAKRMVEKTAALQDAFGAKAWARAITVAETGGTIQTINAKSSTQDGHNPHLAVLDELHAHRDRGLYDVIRSAFGARANPLLWMITTAGFSQHGVCYEQRTFTTKVLEQAIEAPHYFGIIYTLDDDDDAFDEAVWRKANPLLGTAVQLSEMRAYATEARHSPASEGEFKTKRLNIWMNAASAWLNAAAWNACAGAKLRLRDFAGLDCAIGADLADKDDITAVNLSAMTAGDQLVSKSWFFVPAAALERASQTDRDNAALYARWQREGRLIVTPGDFVDLPRVERFIRRLQRVLAVRKIVFDQFSAAQAMAASLNEDVAEPVAVLLHKNAANVTDPAKDLEARIKAGPEKLRHCGSPVMAWMISNAVVSRRVDGSILPKKETPNSMNKIDGVDAMINAIAPLLTAAPAETGALVLVLD